MSISSNFPFDIKNNDEEDSEVLPFVKEYSNYVFPGQNIRIIPDTVIPLDKVPDFKDFLQENFTQAPQKEQVPQVQQKVQAPKQQAPQVQQVQQAPQAPQAPQVPQQKAQAPQQQVPQQKAQAPQQQVLRQQEQVPQVQQVLRQQQAQEITKIPLPTKPTEPKQKIEPTQKIETQSNMSILRLVNTFEQKQKELEEKQKELERKQMELEKKQKDSGEDNNYIPLPTTDNILADTGIVSNPVNILARERSNLTTNPFIPNEQRIREFEVIDKRANEIMQRAYDKNDIYNFSINDINKNISKSTVEFLDDLFVKPENENWIEYLQVILLKNERYMYFGFILIMFVIFMKFIE
jgi:hypothetical protein